MKPKIPKPQALIFKLRITLLLLALCPSFFAPGQTAGWADLSANIPTPVENANLTDVAAIGESVWITSSNLKGVFRSDDGGNTFVFDTLNVGIQGLYRFPDGQRGWAVGGAYGFSTSDGGQHWSPVFIGSTLLSVTFANEQTGYVTGLGSVYRTDDAGATWVKQSDIINLYNRDVMDAAFPDPLNPLNGFVCVANEINTIFKTGDGGFSWEYVTLSQVTSSVNDLEMPGPDAGWAVGGAGNIFRFESINWTFQSSSSQQNLNSVTVSPSGNEVWAAGNDGTILHRMSSGVWELQATGLTDAYLGGIDAAGEGAFFAVGTDKTFLKYSNTQGTGNTEEDERQWVLVFPNPTSGTVNLKSFDNRWQTASAELLNLYGNLLEIKAPGTIESDGASGTIELDLSNYPAGIYLIRIVVDDHAIVKKIIKY